MKNINIRNSTKRWSDKEDRFIMTCMLPKWIQSYIIGRSENAIYNRIMKLKRSYGG